MNTDEIYFDYKGWRFRAPFRCMNCGIGIDYKQWAFGRCCGPCDCGHGPKPMLRPQMVFSGPRELINPDDPYFIHEDRFMPKDAPSIPHTKPACYRRPSRPEPVKTPFRQFNQMAC